MCHPARTHTHTHTHTHARARARAPTRHDGTRTYTHTAPGRPSLVYVDSGDNNDGKDDTDQLAAAYLALGYQDGVNFRHVVQPGAAHAEYFWAQRFPGAMQLLLGEVHCTHDAPTKA